MNNSDIFPVQNYVLVFNFYVLDSIVNFNFPPQRKVTKAVRQPAIQLKEALASFYSNKTYNSCIFIVHKGKGRNKNNYKVLFVNPCHWVSHYAIKIQVKTFSV